MSAGRTTGSTSTTWAARTATAGASTTCTATRASGRAATTRRIRMSTATDATTAIPRRRKSRAVDRSRRVRATARAPSALPTSRGRPSMTSVSAWCLKRSKGLFANRKALPKMEIFRPQKRAENFFAFVDISCLQVARKLRILCADKRSLCRCSVRRASTKKRIRRNGYCKEGPREEGRPCEEGVR